jgi:NNP family nitrate/nitrite transporter-like MFS transporter
MAPSSNWSPGGSPGQIGVISGIVGAAGGLGGFVLPNVLGSLRQLTQSYSGGFLAFALIGALGAVALSFVGWTWEGTFLGKGGVAEVRPTPGRAGMPRASQGL